MRPPDAALERKAFEAAVRALSHKARTEAELRMLLAERGFADAVEDVVLRLQEMDELDDARFAALYAADKRELRGWGPERIRVALVQRGIAEGIAAAAVAGEDAGEQAERAAGLLDRPWRAPERRT